MAPNDTTVLLLQSFQEFYQSVVTYKQSIQDSQDFQQENSVSIIFEALLSQLRQVELNNEAIQYDGALNFVDEARYVMAVLADEIFLFHCGDWFGKEEWNNNLLETKLFGTRSAGSVFFQKIPAVLESSSPERKNIAALYLYAIAFGFRGQYNGQSDQGLGRYQQQLYQYLYPESSLDESEKLIPEAYEYTLIPSKKHRFPNWKPWAIALGAYLVFYLVGSYGAWRWLMEDLIIQTDRIQVQTLVIEDYEKTLK